MGKLWENNTDLFENYKTAIKYIRNIKHNSNIFRYWENLENTVWRSVGILAAGDPNDGEYTFNPSTITRNTVTPSVGSESTQNVKTDWTWFTFGAIRVTLLSDLSGRVDGEKFF